MNGRRLRFFLGSLSVPAQATRPNPWIRLATTLRVLNGMSDALYKGEGFGKELEILCS